MCCKLITRHRQPYAQQVSCIKRGMARIFLLHLFEHRRVVDLHICSHIPLAHLLSIPNFESSLVDVRILNYSACIIACFCQSPPNNLGGFALCYLGNRVVYCHALSVVDLVLFMNMFVSEMLGQFHDPLMLVQHIYIHLMPSPVIMEYSLHKQILPVCHYNLQLSQC